MSPSCLNSFISGFSLITPLPEQGTSHKTASNAPSHSGLNEEASPQTGKTLSAPIRSRYD